MSDMVVGSVAGCRLSAAQRVTFQPGRQLLLAGEIEECFAQGGELFEIEALDSLLHFGRKLAKLPFRQPQHHMPFVLQPLL